MRPVTATPRHEEMRLAVIAAMRPFDDVPAIEQLAVLAVFVGQLVALQDSTRFSGDMIMALLASNIEMGNANAITGVAMGVIKL